MIAVTRPVYTHTLALRLPRELQIEGSRQTLTPLGGLDARFRNGSSRLLEGRNAIAKRFPSVFNRLLNRFAVGHAPRNVGVFDEIPATFLLREAAYRKSIGVEVCFPSTHLVSISPAASASATNCLM
jgi:hypothetical protein